MMEMDARETEQQWKLAGFDLVDQVVLQILEHSELLDFIKIILQILRIEFHSVEMDLKFLLKSEMMGTR